MRPGASFVLALGAAAGSIGCLIPRPLTTRTEVITAADSRPAFGPKAELRAFDETLVVAWDPSAGSYLAKGGETFPRSLRVARFKGDVYLFQAELLNSFVGIDGYALILARVSKEGDAIPLACDLTPSAAADFGVRTSASELQLDLRGERADILGLLGSVLPTCEPLLRIAHWTPPTGELAAAGAEPRASGTPGCRSCPEGACVQGMVVDLSGAVLPGATVRAEPRSGSKVARTAESDEEGTFLVTGLPAGSYELSIELSGFRKAVSKPFAVTPSVTYLFESPFELQVGIFDESASLTQQPIACRKARTRTSLKRSVPEDSLHGPRHGGRHVLESLGGAPRGGEASPCR